MYMNNENVSSRWIAVGVDKIFLPKDEEFDEFFVDEEEYEACEEEYESESSERLTGWHVFNDDKEPIGWIDADVDESPVPEFSSEEIDDYSDGIFHCYEMGRGQKSDVFEDGIPIFEGRIHDYEMDRRNSWLIRDRLRYAEDPELVCMTLALMACSFYRWKAVNVGFVISNLKKVIREIYNIDEEEFNETWGKGRMREHINNISELVYYLRYKLIKCDDEIDYTLANSDGGEFAYTLFANIFGNKVFNPYDTDSFDYGDPRSVDYRSLV